MKKFWKWKNQAATETAPAERTLFLNGTIAEESWFDDDVTPQLFKEELMNGSGPITIWINSPGGDCVAAAQIYNMLMDYPHDVTVKIDGIAASAASVVAMAGTKVLVSPVSMMMIHNPMRSKAPMPQVINALQVGTDSEGGFLVPDEYERTLVEALEEENIFRQLAHVIQTSSGDRKIPVVATKGTASWIDEEGAYPERVYPPQNTASRSGMSCTTSFP